VVDVADVQVDMLALYRPIEAADVAVLAVDVRDVYTDYTRPMCRVNVADVQADVLAVCRPIEAADVAVVTADVRDVYTDYTRPMYRVNVDVHRLQTWSTWPMCLLYIGP